MANTATNSRPSRTLTRQRVVPRRDVPAGPARLGLGVSERLTRPPPASCHRGSPAGPDADDAPGGPRRAASVLEGGVLGSWKASRCDEGSMLRVRRLTGPGIRAYWRSRHCSSASGGRHSPRGRRVLAGSTGWQYFGEFSQVVDSKRCGPLAQLVEQQTLNLRVRGSSPWRLTNKINNLRGFWRLPRMLPHPRDRQPLAVLECGRRFLQNASRAPSPGPQHGVQPVVPGQVRGRLEAGTTAAAPGAQRRTGPPPARV